MLRATWAEFERLATSLSDLDRPLSMSVHGNDTITVGASPVYSVMLDSAPVIDWLEPGGSFNAGTGVWTCAAEGLYAINGRVVSAPFAAPATKSYAVLAQLTKTPVVGVPVVYAFTGGGLDDQNVTAAGTILIPLAQGDSLRLTAAGVHATKSGSNTVQAFLNVVRQSGTGNAD
jgi:hypothetical protein